VEKGRSRNTRHGHLKSWGERHKTSGISRNKEKREQKGYYREKAGLRGLCLRYVKRQRGAICNKPICLKKGREQRGGGGGGARANSPKVKAYCGRGTRKDAWFYRRRARNRIYRKQKNQGEKGVGKRDIAGKEAVKRAQYACRFDRRKKVWRCRRVDRPWAFGKAGGGVTKNSADLSRVKNRVGGQQFSVTF